MQQDPIDSTSLQALEAAVASWRELGSRYGAQLCEGDWLEHGSDRQRAATRFQTWLPPLSATAHCRALHSR